MLKLLQSRYEKILKKIQQKKCTFTCVAVSKGQSIAAIEALYSLGHRDFGESYVQELTIKAKNLNKRGCLEIRWHFIGHLQTNKVKHLFPYLYAVHSLDSIKLANVLSEKWRMSCRSEKLRVFVEVNIDSEVNKRGIPQEQVLHFCEQIHFIPGIWLLGLMCIPRQCTDPLASRASFARLRGLEYRCHPFTEGGLSMGMSDDYELALLEGATHLRIGTALFGSQNLERTPS